MKYWVYINDKVVGPYEEDKLAELEGFTPETLICTETGDPGTTQEWVKASALFDFPDPATITQGQLNPQDADSQFFAPQAEPDNALTSMLLAKIDKLMNEIEGMKGKLDDAIAASNAAQQAASKQINALAEHHNTPESSLKNSLGETDPASVQNASSAEDENLDNTVNLVKHAEQVILQAQQTGQNKPSDFLDEIQIGEKDNTVEKSNGEEVVLRSALDSLYNVSEPVEEEKESTFQDLLSPITANLQQTHQTEETAATVDEVFAEKPVAQEESATNVTEEQREQIINEITASAPQEDALLQAVENAAEETPAAEQEKQPAQDIPVEKEQEIPSEETPQTQQQVTEGVALAVAGVVAGAAGAAAMAEQSIPAEQEPAPVEETPVQEETPAEQAPLQEPETPAEQTPVQEELQPSAEEMPSQEQESPVEEPISLEQPAATQEESAPVQEAPVLEEISVSEEAPAEDVVEIQQDAPAADIPEIPVVSQEEEPSPLDFASADKEGLDLSDHPQLAIQDVAEEDTPQSIPSIEESAVPVAANLDQVELTPMDPSAGEHQEQEKTESILELVPGKELEKPQSDGLISQEDLDDAFMEQQQTPENAFIEREPAPEDTPVQSEQPAESPIEQPEVVSVQQDLPKNEEPYNLKEMTEIQLKEGSTYLISDFIPPSETGNKQEFAATIPLGVTPKSATPEKQTQQQEETDATMIEIVPQKNEEGDSQEKAEEAETQSEQKNEPQPEKQEQAAPEQKEKEEASHDAAQFPPAADLTLSQIKLENTIKPKRGATRDIKTVPMVREPAASERLDLSDSDLDLSAQHDLKAADLEPIGGGLLKGVLSLLASVVLLVVIYFMLSFLNLIPAKYNLIKSNTAAEEVQTADVLDQDISTAQRPASMPNIQEDQLGALSETNIQPAAADPMAAALSQVKNYVLSNGQTLEQLINARHPAAKGFLEWNVTTAVEPDNYSVLVKVPPENAQSFKISYRFNYNTVTKTLDPTISDSKNLLDSIK